MLCPLELRYFGLHLVICTYLLDFTVVAQISCASFTLSFLFFIHFASLNFLSGVFLPQHVSSSSRFEISERPCSPSRSHSGSQQGPAGAAGGDDSHGGAAGHHQRRAEGGDSERAGAGGQTHQRPEGGEGLLVGTNVGCRLGPVSVMPPENMLIAHQKWQFES